MAGAKRLSVLRRELLEIEQKRDIIPDVLPVGPGFWYGASTAGKTGLVVRTAVALAGGLQWADRNVSRGCVLYVAGEAPKSVARRLCAVAEYLDQPIDDLPISLMSCPAKGLIDNSTRIEVQANARGLMTETKLPMSLIVFDTLAQCFGDGSPDDTTAAIKAVKNMIALSEEFDCAVLGIHHPGKKDGAGGGMRGSGVFFNDVDYVGEITRKGGTSILTVRKNKDGADGSRFAFSITGVDLRVAGGTKSVQVVKDLNAWSKTGQGDKEADKAKRNLTDKAVALSLFTDLAKDGIASRTEWQNACYAHWTNKSSQAARKQAFSTACRKLQEDGIVSINGDTVSVSESKNMLSSLLTHTSPETVSVSESTTPLIGGVHLRADSRIEVPLQEQNGSSFEDGGSVHDGTVGRSNDLPRGAGVEDPAECQAADAFAVASTGTGG